MLTQTVVVLAAPVPAVIVPPNPIPVFQVSVPVSETFTATGCKALQCVWSSSGTLPPGVTFATVGANGVLSGIPTTAGTFTFSINAV